MKVVLTVWEDRISPVSNSAGRLLVVDVENRTIRGRRTESLDAESVFYRARRLSDLEAAIFICGAIWDFFAGLLEGCGIRLIPFICGKAERCSMRKYKHIFGPVPSRRLGRSLGVDITPYKTCSQDCVFCQLGRTPNKTIIRGEYVPIRIRSKRSEAAEDERS